MGCNKNPAGLSLRQEFNKSRGTCACDIPEAGFATGLGLAS